MIRYCLAETAAFNISHEHMHSLLRLLIFYFVDDKKNSNFHVSDEEYPTLSIPPLPLSSPPCSPSLVSYPSTKRNIITSQPSHEERQNLLATEMRFHQTKCTAHIEDDNIGFASTESGLPYSQGFIASETPKNQHLLGCYTQDETFEMAQPLVKDMSDGIQNYPGPVFTCTSVTSSRSPTFISDFQDLSVNTTAPVNDSECSTVEGASPVHANLTVMQGLEKTVDRMVQVICQGKCRFDYVYHPNRQAKGLYKMLKNIFLTYLYKMLENVLFIKKYVKMATAVYSSLCSVLIYSMQQFDVYSAG